MSNSKNLPLLIFDLDGTLIDSAADIHLAMNKMLARHDRESVDFATLVSHIGDGLPKLVNDFFPEFELKSSENREKVDEFLLIYESHLIDNTKMYPGVSEFLHSYKGHKAIVTNKNIHPTRKILEHLNLHRLDWVDVLGGDSLAEKKPSALPLLHVMKKVNATMENTWMIGDGRPDMLSAKNAGTVKVAVHYGYSRPEELAPYQPNYVLENFSDLNGLI